MRTSFLTVGFSLILLNFLFAQSDLEKKLKEEIWTNCPTEFKTTTIPDKWKNESAVIIALRKDYIVYKNFEEKVNIHFRIKLLDKAAVEDFSELSFNNKNVSTNFAGKPKSYNIVGIKVIKPSGSSKEVDLSAAVKTDAGSKKDLKIPIPNLEPGDIIDYFLALKIQNYTKPSFGDEDILEGKYPVMNTTFTYELSRDYIFHGFSFNGAPQFKKVEKIKEVTYTLKDEMREKAPDIMWEYEYRTSPHVRYYISSTQEETNFKDKANKILDGVTYNYKYTNTGYIEDYIKENFKKEKDHKKVVEEVYYLLRNPIYRKLYFNEDQGEPLKSNYTPDLYFYLLGKYFTSKKISYEFLVVPTRRGGPFSDLVNLSSCDLLLKVNTNPTMYIARPSPFSIPGETPYYFEGMEGVSRSYIPKATQSKDRKIDSTSVNDNSTITKLMVSVNAADKTRIDVKRSVESKGHTKVYHQYLVCTNFDYLKEYDLPKYQVQRSSALRKLLSDYNKEKDKLEQRITQDYHERDEKVKNAVEKQMVVKVSDYKDLKINKIGMWGNSPNIQYSDAFTIDNITKKAGPNLLVEVGKLIEEQATIKEKERTRTRDIYMEYPRSFSNEISFTIPEGYSVEGLENFNKKSETPLGGFVSSAKMNGNVLTINTRKFYNKNYYPSSDWPKIVEFLDAAVACYNSKILLKKK